MQKKRVCAIITAKRKSGSDASAHPEEQKHVKQQKSIGKTGETDMKPAEKNRFSNINIFTLMELLVVISVIAVLAGLLLPALNSAREKGMAISCTNSQKQIGTGVSLYTGDFAYYPWPCDNGFWDLLTGMDSGNNRISISYLPPRKNPRTGKYENLIPAVYCPKHEPYRPTAGSKSSIPAYSYIYYSESWKRKVITGKQANPESAARPENVRSPSKKIWLFETPLANRSHPYIASYTKFYQPGTEGRPLEPPVHGMNMNVLHYDGHVSSMHIPSQLSRRSTNEQAYAIGLVDITVP